MKIIFITLSLFLGFNKLCSQTANVGIGTTTPASKLTVNGSFAAAYGGNITSTTYNAGENDFYISWNGTAAGTVILPNSTAGADRTGRIYCIKNLSAVYTLTVDANGSELIDTKQTVSLNPGESGVFIKTNVNTATGATYELALLSRTDGSYRYAVSSSTAETHAQGAAIKANFTAIDYSTNGGGDFNLTTDTWTCPKNGSYRIEFMETGSISTLNVSAHRSMSIYKNGLPQTNQIYTMTILGLNALQASQGYDTTILTLQQGDTITGQFAFCNGCGATSMTSAARKMIITRL